MTIHTFQWKKSLMWTHYSEMSKEQKQEEYNTKQAEDLSTRTKIFLATQLTSWDISLQQTITYPSFSLWKNFFVSPFISWFNPEIAGVFQICNDLAAIVNFPSTLVGHHQISITKGLMQYMIQKNLTNDNFHQRKLYVWRNKNFPPWLDVCSMWHCKNPPPHVSIINSQFVAHDFSSYSPVVSKRRNFIALHFPSISSLTNWLLKMLYLKFFFLHHHDWKKKKSSKWPNNHQWSHKQQ